MKSLLVLCFFLVAVAYGLPAKNADSFEDSEMNLFLFPINRQQKKEVPSVVEVEMGDSDEDTSFFPSYFRPLFINPFSFMNFGFSDFFSRPSWFDSLMPKNIPDAAVKNATSSTKVVDGHKITVNETTYENEKNGAVYRFQVIEVSPVDSKEKDDKESGEKEFEQPGQTEQPEQPQQPDTRAEAESTEEVKPDQNSQDNEIHREEMLSSYELQGDDPSVLGKYVDISHNGKRENVDLSGDIRVNKLLAENTRRGGLFMIPPEVEVFDVVDYDQRFDNYQQQIIEPQLNQEIIKPQFNQQ